MLNVRIEHLFTALRNPVLLVHDLVHAKYCPDIKRRSHLPSFCRNVGIRTNAHGLQRTKPLR